MIKIKGQKKKKEVQLKERVFGCMGPLENSGLTPSFQFSPIKKEYQILQQVVDGWFAL